MRGSLDDIKWPEHVANARPRAGQMAIIRRKANPAKARMQHTRHLVIVGHVQSVGFRYAMVMKAAEIGITGWVRNRSDGAVEAIVQGSPEAVARMLAWARHGPRSARVERVEVEPAEGEFGTFEARDSE